MNKRGPIIIIEENIEDRRLFAHIFLELSVNNEILYFDTLQYAEEELLLNDRKPFIFFANILQFQDDSKHQNLEKHQDISQKLDCPCMFYSVLFPNCFVIDTHSVPTKSYFINPYSEEKFKQTLGSIINFWNSQQGGKSIEGKERKQKQNL
ncbi:hypothetical protein K6T82_11400 [Flavobacterium sp. 17A]|uniref:CheY chemotaxis protein or a CheY-like REC (Receiver) domain n=1 Tax=Flavobacterium potami TaxID=2872310 RepID=A0A9X1HBE9_9FLAO|nr:hypothetical protein [Flavobacterium potami]MBZ4035374.1 hypothetical protein [Flavobacterium potami]